MSPAPDPKDDIFIAAAELINQKGERLTTGSRNLDNLFGGGGIETGAITQFYGAPGSGKTQLCYTVCALSTSEYKAVYIDTEGTFRPERIESIARARGLDPTKILPNIKVAKPLNSQEQESYIETACSAIKSNSKIKLLVVDSMTAHYRVDYAGRSRLPERQQKLNKYMHMLINTARTHRVAVVVTNHQMQSSPDSIFGNRAIPVGGYIISYASTYRIHLRRLSPEKFCATLDISPCHAQSDTDFTIDQRGVVDFSNGYDTQAPLRRRI
jgi:DNA repair protein RadA